VKHLEVFVIMFAAMEFAINRPFTGLMTPALIQRQEFFCEVGTIAVK